MKTKIVIFAVFVSLVCLWICSDGFARSEMTIADLNVPLADYEGPHFNNVGGQFGIWELNPSDDSQSCSMKIVSDGAVGSATSIQLRYDVESANTAYNGFWMSLENADLSDFNTFNLYVKGDAGLGYSKRLKIELKSKGVSSAYIISGVTDEWKKFSIPFNRFKKIKDWQHVDEFVIVFNDTTSRPAIGSIYIDDISVSKSPMSLLNPKRVNTDMSNETKRRTYYAKQLITRDKHIRSLKEEKNNLKRRVIEMERQNILLMSVQSKLMQKINNEEVAIESIARELL